MPFKDVPSNVEFPTQEREIQRWWQENQSFQKLRQLRQGGPKWSFIDGPITANNPMGVHHAWGRTYKDLYNRYKAMRGHELRFQQGFDCQGLWVEVEVEKEMGFTSKKDIEAYGMAAFVNKCKERVLRYSAVQTEQSVRLGYWMDWNDREQLRLLADKIIANPTETITIAGPAGPVTDTVENIVGRLGLPELGGSYYTFSNENNYMIWRALKTCADKGWLYRGADVMPWCPRCATAISQHEIVTDGYAEITHRSVTLKFPLRDKPGESLLVWTTTPWTLTSNVAAAVGPELDYAKVKMAENGEIFYLSKGTLGMLRGKYEIVAELKGAEMVGWRYDGPFDELPAEKEPGGWTHLKELLEGILYSAAQAHQVIAWKEVGEAEGTGIVHIAPGAGAEDYALGREYNLPIVAPLNDEGYFIEGFGPLTGLPVGDSADIIFNHLAAKGLLYHVEPYTHRYPTCWRCATELVFRLVDEWFISMHELRPLLMDITRRIEWIPAFGLERELDWLKNMHDWMISKKRYWGLALPIWECDFCDHWTVVGDDLELKERAAAGYEKFAGHTPHRPWIDEVLLKCDKCGGMMTRVPDVGNPWLDAGIVSFSTLRYRQDPEYWRKWYPADWISESFPGQFRNWFYSMLVMGAILDKSTSFRSNFGYATLWAEDGRPMHKSWGNAIEFNEAADKMGVDVMRWMYCNHKPENNLLFGYHRADEVRRQFLIPLWNVYNFFVTYANLDGWTPGPELRATVAASQNPLDRWIVARLNEVLAKVTAALDKYDAFGATLAVQPFLEDLTNWYVRRSRRRFWRGEQDDDKEAAYATLYHVLTTLCRMLAPFTPFVTEAIYQNLARSVDANAPESVHHCSWPEADPAAIDLSLIEQMALARQIASLGLGARGSANIKVRQPLARALVHVGAGRKISLPPDLAEIVTDELNVKSLEFVAQAGELITYKILPNLKLLGPKLGKQLPVVRKAITAFFDTGELAHELEAMRENIAPGYDTRALVAQLDHLRERVAGLETPELVEKMQEVREAFVRSGIRELPDKIDEMILALTAFDVNKAAVKIQAGESITLTFAGQEIELAAAELLIQTEPAAGLAVVADKVLTVGVDVVITDALAAEGMARELVRRIQNMRKEAGFEIADKITVYYQTEGVLHRVFQQWGDYIKTETLATTLKHQLIPEAAFQRKEKVEGQDLLLGVKQN
jgi:isoleucyl-tRNA synthetase